MWNLKVNYCLYKSPLLVPVLRQANAIYILKSCYIKIHCNIILPVMFAYHKCSFLVRFWNWNFVCSVHLFHACCVLCPDFMLFIIIAGWMFLQTVLTTSIFTSPCCGESEHDISSYHHLPLSIIQTCCSPGKFQYFTWIQV